MLYFRKILILLPVILLVSCVSKGNKIAFQDVSTIQKNITTEADIRHLFGEPVTSKTNLKSNTKILTYGYKNSNQLSKDLAGVAGGVAGGAVGSQIGDGSGAAIFTGIGFLLGSFFANNAVTARTERQYLEVILDLSTNTVVDYNYSESKKRTQTIGVSPGVGTL